MARRVKAVWLDVTESFVEAAPADDPRRAVREWLKAGDENQSAIDGEAIGRCLDRLGARGARVHALWRRDGATPLAVRTAASGKAAREAAVLSLIGTGEVDPSVQSIASTLIGATDTGEASVFVSSVDAGVINEFERTIREAGAKPGRVVAGDGPAAIAASRDAALFESDDPAASLVIGEHHSAIAVRSGGALRLCRFIDVGASTLREAYARSLRSDGMERAEANAAAERLLFEALGVPAPSDGQRERVDAAETLRTMQPVLQRIGVELKQSIRFTLSDAERLRVRLRLAGPARSISTLESILAEQIEAEAAPGENQPGGWIELALACDAASWKPAEPGEAIGESDRRAPALYAGAAVAMLALVAGGAIAQRAAQEAQDAAEAVERSIDVRRASAAPESQREVARHLEDLRRVIASEVGTGTHFGAALALLAEATAGEAVIESLSGRRDEGGSALDLRLEATSDSAEDARAKLQRVIARLDGSALSAEVSIGSMQIGQMEGGGVRASGRAGVSLRERRSAWLHSEIER
jgi:hypothetical protein